MRLNLVKVALLCFITWMSSAQATHGLVSDCCLHWSNTKIAVGQIVSYTHKLEGICPIKAVTFQTVKGKRICSNPDDIWAKKAILSVDMRTQALQMKRNHVPPTISSATQRFQMVNRKQISPNLDKDQDKKAILKVDEETQTLGITKERPQSTSSPTQRFQTRMHSERKGNNEEGPQSTVQPTVSSTSERFERMRSDPDSSPTTKAALTVAKQTPALQKKGNDDEHRRAPRHKLSFASKPKSKPKRRPKNLKPLSWRKCKRLRKRMKN